MPDTVSVLSVLEVYDAKAERDLERLVRQGDADASSFARFALMRLTAGDALDARDRALEGLALDPDHTGCLLALARAQLRLRAEWEAVRTYQKLVEWTNGGEPGLVEEWQNALTTLSEKVVKQGHVASLEEASRLLGHRVLRASAKARKHGLDVAKALLSLYLRQKDVPGAKRTLERARAVGLSEDAEVFARGQIAATSGDISPSKELFSRWVAMAPDAKRWLRIAHYYRALYRVPEALWAYRRGTDTFPANQECWNKLAHMLVLARKPAEASDAWKRVAALAVNQGKKAVLKTQLEGAMALRQAGYSQHSLALYSEMMKQHADDHALFASYGEYLLQLGRTDELVSIARDYITRFHSKTSGEALTEEQATRIHEAVEMVSKAGQIQAAIELLKSLETKGPRATALCVLKAKLEDLQANPRARDATMEHCTSMVLNDPKATLRVAQGWLTLGMPERANAMSKQLLGRDESHVEAALLGISALEAARKYKALDRAIGAFVEKYGYSRAWIEALVSVFVRTGQWKQADAFLRGALDGDDPQMRATALRELAWLYIQPQNWDDARAETHVRAWFSVSAASVTAKDLERFLNAIKARPNATTLRRLLLERNLIIAPNDTETRWKLGEVLLTLRAFDEARSSFEKVLESDTMHARAIERIAHQFTQAGASEHAYFFLSRLELTRITRTETLVDLGRMYDARKLKHKALACFEQYLTRAAGTDHDAAKLERFAESMLRHRRTHLAIKAYQILAERKPRSKSTLLGLGNAHLQAGEPLAARAVFERLLAEKKGANLPTTLDKIADLYLTFGMTRDAARILEEKLALERNRWQAPSFARLAALYREHGDKEGLLRICKLFLDRGFNRGRAVEVASRELERAGLIKEAIELIKSVLKTDGRRIRNTRVLIRRAIRVASLLEDESEMLEQARAYVEPQSGQSNAWIEAAGFLREHHRLRLAIQLLEEGIRRLPASQEIRVERARLLLDAGRVEEGEVDLTEALKNATSVPETMKAIRRMLGGGTNNGLLARLENLARAFQPNRTDGYLTLGKILAANGDRAGARRAFARYLDRNPRGHLKVARAYGNTFVEDALRHYRNAELRVTSTGIAVLREVANLLEQTGDSERLSAHVRRFLLQADKPTQGFEIIGDLWLSLGHPEQAASWLERALQEGATPGRYRKLGRLYASLERPERSVEAFFQYVSALQLSPAGRRTSFREQQSYKNAVSEVVGFLVERKGFADARRFIARLAQAHGSTMVLRSHQVELLIRGGNVPEALNVLEKARREAPGFSAEQVERLARALTGAAYFSEALALLDASKMGRTAGALGRLRIRLLIRLGRRSELDLAVAQQTNASTPDAELVLGLLLFSEGEFMAARPILASYISRGVGDRMGEARHALRKIDALFADAGQKRGNLPERSRRGSPFQTAATDAILAHAGGRYAEAWKSAVHALQYYPQRSDMVQIAVRAGLLANVGKAFNSWLVKRVRFEARHSETRKSDIGIVRILKSTYAPRYEAIALQELYDLTSFSPRLARRTLQAHLKAGNGDDARAIAETLLARSTDRLADRSRLISLFLTAGDIEQARKLVALSIRENADRKVPSNEHPLIDTMRVLLAGGEKEELRKLAQTLVEQEDAAPRLLLKAAETLEAYRGPADLTAALLSHDVFQGVPSERTLRLRARAAWRLQDKDTARATLRTLVQRFPPLNGPGFPAYIDLLRECVWAADAETLDWFVSTLVSQTDQTLGSVVGFIAGLIHDAPAHSERFADKAFITTMQQLIHRAEALGQDEQQIVSARSYLLEAEGKFDRVLRLNRAVAAREGRNPTTMNNTAYLYARMGKHLEQGLRLVRKASARSLSTQPSFSDTEAWLLHKLDRPEAAYPRMMEALILTDWSRAGYGHAELLYHHMKILERLGRRDEAKRVARHCARYRFKSRYGRKCATAAMLGVDQPL